MNIAERIEMVLRDNCLKSVLDAQLVLDREFIFKRYNQYKLTLDFESAFIRAKIEWLEMILDE
jgi:hypothetical protein